MKNKKRWLAGLLAMILIMNTFVGSALAKNEDEVSTQSATEQEVQTTESTDTTETSTEAEKTTTEEKKTTEGSTKNTEEKKEQAATTEKKKKVSQKTRVIKRQNNVRAYSSVTSSFDDMCNDIFNKNYEEFSADNDYKEIYVAGDRQDELTDQMGSKNKPYISLQEAYSSEEQNGTKGVIIHLQDDYTVDGKNYSGYKEKLNSWPSKTIPAIIISDNMENVNLKMNGLTWNLTSNTGFYQIKVEADYSVNECANIFANGHTAVFGGYGESNFDFINNSKSNRWYPTLFGASSKDSGTASSHSSVSSTCIKVYGGTWNQILGGGEYYSDVEGTAKVVIDGYNGQTAGYNNASVKFDNKKPFYVGNYFRVLGGGAGTGTSVSKSTFSNVGSTNVDLKNVTVTNMTGANLGVTPAGGYVSKEEKLSVENCWVTGDIDIRAPGQSAKSAIIDIKSSVVSGTVSSQGTLCKNVYGRILDNCDITIDDSKVNRVRLKASSIGEGEPNILNGVDILIKDSNLNMFSLGSLWAPTKEGIINKIEFDNSNIVQCYTNLRVESIDTISLKNMGNADKYFEINKQLWGYGDNVETSVTNLVMENSYVDLSQNKEFSNVELKDSHLKVSKNVTLGIAKKYLSKGNNEINLCANSFIDIQNEASGATADISSGLEKEGERAGIRWTTTRGEDSLFSSKVSDPVKFKKNKTNKVINWGIRYGTDPHRFIYVDSEIGDDNSSDNLLGFSIEHPVKTIKKAYELVENENDIIVICNDYHLKDMTQDFIPDDMNKKDFQVTITSKDDFNDFQVVASLDFECSEDSFLNLNASFKFKDIVFKNEAAKARRIFANGYNTYMDDSVMLKDYGMTNKAYYNFRFELYGGSNNAGVNKTNLEIHNANWRVVSAGGYGNNSYVGSGDPEQITDEDIAVLKIDYKQSQYNYVYSEAYKSKITYYGDVYGNVSYEINLISGFGSVFNYNNNEFDSGTVYGNFKTKISTNQYASQVAYPNDVNIAPKGITVKGDTILDLTGGKANILLGLTEGNFGNIEANIAAERVTSISLFDSKTVFNKLSWTFDSTKMLASAGICGADNNESLKKNAKLDLTLKNCASTNIKTGLSKSGIDNGYYKNKNVKLSLQNVKSNSFNSIDGFGTIEFNNCDKLNIYSNLQTTQLISSGKGTISLLGKVKIGEETENTGQVSITDNVILEANNEFIINGNLCGNEKEENNLGELLNNYADEDNNVNKITVNGNVVGKLYYSSSYEKAEITAKGQSTGNEIIAIPIAYEGQAQQKISCIPDISEGECKDRTWTVINPISKKYIYVDGTLDTTSSEYEKHDGTTPEYAYATMAEAYNAVLKDGYIIICGDIDISSWPGAATKPVTITSKVTLPDGTKRNYYDSINEKKATLKLNSALRMQAATTFEYLNIQVLKSEKSNETSIAAYGYPLTMGHKGDSDSLNITYADSSAKLSIAGGGNIQNTTINTKESCVKIYAGTYGDIVAGNYQPARYKYYGPDVTFDHAELVIDHASVNAVLLVCDNTSTIKSGDIKITNTEIKEGFYADEGIIQRQGALGTFQIEFGENMKFSNNAELMFGNAYKDNQDRVTEGDYKVSIDGTGGQKYKIPVIRSGNDSASLDDNSKVEISLKNVEVGTFYGAGIRNRDTAWNTQVILNLLEGSKVSNIFAGGKANCGAKFVVSIDSNDAEIDKFISSSEENEKIPEECEVVFNKIGTDANFYKIPKTWDLNGSSKIQVIDAKVNFSEIGSAIKTGELNLSKNGQILLKQKSLTVNGNYVGSSDKENPSVLSGSNALNLRINGNVTGYSQVICTDSEEGNFPNGCNIYGDTSEINAADMFETKSKENFEFVKGDSQDRWYLNDTEDSDKRTNIYVASYGNNSSDGTYAQPVQNLTTALKKADILYDTISNNTEIEDDEKNNLLSNITIVLLDDIELTDDEQSIQSLNNKFNVRVTSYGKDKNKIIFTKNRSEFMISKSIEFDNVIFADEISNNRAEIFANGYQVTFAENVETQADGNCYPILYGGAKDMEVDQTKLTVYGGKWTGIYGGGKNSSAKVTGNVNLTVGKQIDMLNVGSYAETLTGLFGGGHSAEVSGNITLTIDGGVYHRIHGGGKTRSAITKNILVNFNYGMTDMFYGGGENGASSDIEVHIGQQGIEDKTIINKKFRGGPLYAACDKTSINIENNTEIKDTCEFACGGYSGFINETKLNVNGGKINTDVYTGGWGEGTPEKYGNTGQTTIAINDGTISGNVFAGGNMGYVGSGKAQDKDLSTVSLKGGTITGNIYGGCNIATTYGNTDLTIAGSSIKGNVYGGGKGTDDTAAEITGTTNIKVNDSGVSGNVYGGCDTNGTVANTKVTAIVLPNGNLFAGGYGEKTKVTDTAYLTLKANDTVDKTNKFTAYGGGEKGTVKKTVVNAENWNGDIFGGGKGELKTKNRIGRAFLRIFTESDLIDANVSETNVNVTGTVTGDIFAGGEYATVGTTNESADEAELSKKVSNVTIAGKVNGKVYGGGKGEKDKNYAAINGSTNVTLATGGNVTVSTNAENAKTGVTFGGGQNAPVAGDTNVNVTDGTYSTIFGGNDVSGEIQGKTNVNITGAKTEHAYGAGRDAKYEGTSATVTVNDQTDQTANSKPAISEVYGGGYGEGAQTAKADVAIQNGTVTTAYAGGNAASTKDTEISVTGGHADTVFGGGNAATITGSSKVTVNTTDDTQHADTIFAGNNKASMAIKPTLDFKSGKIGTVYCGGNQGIMTYKSDANSGISYEFDYPKAEIKTVFAGCNNTTETTSDVQLTLISGTYDTIYGGNNQNGAMNHTSVITDASKDSTKAFHVDTIYGGGNQADAVNTSVTLKNGTVKTVYAGGNAATATQSATINTDGQTSNDNMKVTDLYCGNNEAAMAIDPNIDLVKAEITSFYGGGNQGVMTAPNGITYTFDSDDLTIDTIYGGGNEAGVTKSATLNVKKGNYTNIYGGSNSKGTVDTANVNIQGNVGRQDKTDAKIFGGGRGRSTIVNDANVSLQNGTIAGNVYGGSGFGTVGTAKVSAEEASNGIVKVLGNIYGAGYGVTSSADDTQVDVNLKLSMGKDDASKDLNITEILKSTDSTDKSGESKASATWKTTYKDGSYIAGNVFGGGDMGQVGQGYINASTNTAVIEKGGKTSVNVKNGYINGNIFGGGNGQPGGEDESGNKITEYTVYMGTVFGTSNVNMTGGYVNGNIFGCGQQSRTYAAADQNNDNQKDASYVNITTDNNTPILIGGSIFGGGNKGNGTTQNASVATVYGDTHVELQGVKGQYTQIYLLSNGTSGGGVYGDGNLCLVSGKKYVTLRDFSCGTQNSVKLLKTFYSLQRADVVDIIASRIVLKGAVDLVAENADDTAYSVNRVSQLNLKDSSTLKVTKTVNLLGELTSDEQTNRQFIDRGNNNGNAHVGNDYTKHGGKNPTDPLTESDVNDYINAYNSYTQNGSIQAASSYQSINVVCVANGGYLEVKKSAKEYGPVTGLFTLQLVNANPGEGGGFVYADIMGKQMNGQYVTGNFVCVTKQAENSEDYMYAYHNVGGQLSDDGKYEYYLWYLKGNKYSYDVDLTSYIGTKDTEFTKTISLSVEPEYCFVLTELNQTKELSTINLNKMYQNTWSKSKEDSEKFAVEVTLIKKSKSGNNITTNAKSIGYIGYQTTNNTDPEASAKKDGNGKLVWGIWRSDGNGGWKFQACKGNENSFKVESEDALAQIDSNVVNAQLKFTLHKGTGMTTEFRNLPFEIKIAEAKQTDYDRAVTDRSYIQEDSCIRLTTNLNLSAIRLVPTQAAYMGSGRMFAGVSSSSNVNITKTSAFTAQFVTKYIPSAFNTGSTNQIKETLTTSYSDTYLLDENGVGYTVKDLADGTVRVLNVVNSSDPNVKTYDVTKSGDTYRVSYRGQDGNILTKEDGTDKTYSCEVKKQSSGFTLPKGTMITLLASLDEQNPTYWYYYCTEDTTDVKLEDFKKMNTSNTSSSQSGDSVYDTIYTTSSSRVTENMIFVFNFEKVSDSDWNKVSALEGNLQLKHTYNSSVYDSVDIMDYVSAESETSGGTTTISYNREMPRQTDAFKISRDSDGITKFSIENADQSSTYGQKDDMKFRLDITPDTNVTNTQYEEREYAVILKLKDKTSGKEIAFPEGTVFHYNGKQLATGKDNKYVIVPVSTVGSHEVEIASKLEGFDVNQYELIAALYSTSEDGYYNSIKVSNNTDDQTSAGFTVKADPVYALKVTENSASSGDRKKNHFISAGETFKFEVKAKGGESNDAVSIGLYQYNNGKYKKVTLSTILEDNAILKTGTGNWTPKVQEGASKGTYRLEFTYHDKTEYWDFMVR